MACPKCGREINHEQFPLGLTFCPYCGDKVSGQDAQTISFCPYCGRRLLIAATFCPECGKQVSPGTTSHYFVAGSVKPTFPSASSSPKAIPPPSGIDDTPQVMMDTSTPPSQPIWPKVAAICKRAYEPIESIITGRWRLKRLYQDWSLHDALPPDEIPNDDYLKNVSRQTPSPAQRTPLWVIILIAIAVIVIFTIIGILLRR